VRYGLIIIACMCLSAVPCSIHAQGGDDNPAFSSNLGISTSVPLGTTAHYVTSGLGVDYSAGYNFDRHHALVGEVTWNWLYPSDSALDPLRVAFQSQDVRAHGDLVALMANYKFEVRGKLFGAYFIGGGGWYHRSTTISNAFPTGTLVPCQPIWLWWGYNCSSETTITSSTVATSSSNVFGGNAGIGFTIRVGDPPYRWYVESRYHYAPTKNITTQLVTISVGFRY